MDVQYSAEHCSRKAEAIPSFMIDTYQKDDVFTILSNKIYAQSFNKIEVKGFMASHQDKENNLISKEEFVPLFKLFSSEGSYADEFRRQLQECDFQTASFKVSDIKEIIDEHKGLKFSRRCYVLDIL